MQKNQLSESDISDKYIDPPHTTDFGIMFLPFEGIYAEVVRKASPPSGRTACRIDREPCPANGKLNQRRAAAIRAAPGPGSPVVRPFGLFAR